MAVEIHNPDLYGPVALAADPGVVGQVVTSAGPGAQAVWSSPADVTIVGDVTNCAIVNAVEGPPNVWTIEVDPRISLAPGNQLSCVGGGTPGLFVPAPAGPGFFTFNSPSALTHTIVHNLGNAFPAVTVWDTATGDVIVPSTISSNGVNSFDVTFFVARAIAGTVVG